MADHLEKVTKKLIEKNFKKAPPQTSAQNANSKKPQQNIQQQINAKEEEK